jgi:hypothetical protein
MNMLKSFYDNTTNLECDIINYDTKTIINKMKDKYFEFWRHKIINSSKLSFFCIFKKEYKMEKYLSIINNPTIYKLNEEDMKIFLVRNESVNYVTQAKWKTNFTSPSHVRNTNIYETTQTTFLKTCLISTQQKKVNKNYFNK